MTTQQLADRLVELCRAGRNDECYTELFSADAESHEMPGVPDGSAKGTEALLAKSEGWSEGVEEVHEMIVSDPMVYEDHFAVGMTIDMTNKEGKRTRDHEMCVYRVTDGKIISERFHYAM